MSEQTQREQAVEQFKQIRDSGRVNMAMNRLGVQRIASEKGYHALVCKIEDLGPSSYVELLTAVCE